MRARSLLGAVLLLLVLRGTPGESAEQPSPPRIAPITATQLRQVLDDKRGRVVLLNFWATWCRPCLKEIPALTALAERYRAQGLELVPVALDDPGDLESLVRPFLDKWFPDFRTYARTDSSMDTPVSVVDPAWNEVLPTSYILDRNGVVSARIQGGKPVAVFEAAIAPLLAQGSGKEP